MRDRFEQAHTFQEFLDSVVSHREFWHQLADRAVVSEATLEAARSIPGRWHLLALVEGASMLRELLALLPVPV
jgi:hypothetical protein